MSSNGSHPGTDSGSTRAVPQAPASNGSRAASTARAAADSLSRRPWTATEESKYQRFIQAVNLCLHSYYKILVRQANGNGKAMPSAEFFYDMSTLIVRGSQDVHLFYEIVADWITSTSDDFTNYEITGVDPFTGTPQ